MSYPNINAAAQWLADWLDPIANPGTPLQLLSIPNVWNDANDFGVIRRPMKAPDVEDVRIQYLSGKTYEGVIYISSSNAAAGHNSTANRRFEINVDFEVVLVARYNGSDEDHHSLIQALNDTLLVEPQMTDLGGTAIVALPQPAGGDLPEVDARYQTIRSGIRARFQAIYS